MKSRRRGRKSRSTTCSATATTNSREKEQGIDEVAEEDEAGRHEQPARRDRAATPPPKPPFRMEIVEAQDVREVLFDARDGQADPRHGRSSRRRRGPTRDAVAVAAALGERARSTRVAGDADRRRSTTSRSTSRRRTRGNSRVTNCTPIATDNVAWPHDRVRTMRWAEPTRAT